VIERDLDKKNFKTVIADLQRLTPAIDTLIDQMQLVGEILDAGQCRASA